MDHAVSDLVLYEGGRHSVHHAGVDEAFNLRIHGSSLKDEDNSNWRGAWSSSCIYSQKLHIDWFGLVRRGDATFQA